MDPMDRFTYFVEIRHGGVSPHCTTLPPRYRAVPFFSHIDNNEFRFAQPPIQWVPGLFLRESKAAGA
jgi:hypothetical protein